MNDNLEYLSNKLIDQYGVDIRNEIFEGYSSLKKVSFRVNTLKSSKSEIEKVLNDNNIDFDNVAFYNSAFVLNEVDESEIEKLDIYNEGKIYLQSLSSMLPPIILEPKENFDILDMCAAPGGKTAEIAALTNNKANLTACEMNKIRFDRLKYNMEKQGVTNINIMKKDSRFLDDFFSFDQILLDAPCSGSGTINLNVENTYKNFSKELVERSSKLQLNLLRKAIKLLKRNQEMVYSTCSILQEENEAVVQKIITENNVEIIPIEINDIPSLPTKLKGTLCVRPNSLYEGFFVAKLRKKG